MSTIIGIGATPYFSSGAIASTCTIGCGATFFNDGGNTDYIHIADGNGMPDTATYTISMWFKWANTLTGFQSIYGTEQPRVRLRRNQPVAGSGQRITADNAAGTRIGDITQISASLDTDWHHIIISMNHTSGNLAGHLYYDGVNDASPIGKVVDVGVVNFRDGGSEYIPWSVAGSSIAQVWISDEYIDLSVNANLEKFIQAGKPVDLGPTGLGPTGNQPVHCLQGEAPTFETNSGSAVDWSPVGTQLLVDGPGV